MTCEDLFLAAFAVCLGWGYAKEFLKMLDEWIDTPRQDRKKFQHILVGVLLFAFLLYMTYTLSSRQLF